MKKLSLSFGFVLVSLLAGATAAHGAAVEQSASFAYTNDGQLISGSGASQLVDATIFKGQFAPFNASLGTLTACTITFTATAEMSGTADPGAATDGSVSATLGGSFYLNDRAFNGTGNGMAPVTAAPGAPLTATLSLQGFTYTFRPENAGQMYDPAILGFLTGQQPFPLEFRPSGNTVTYSNAMNLAIAVTGELHMTYEYTPAPAAPAVKTLVRHAETGDVTLTWESEEGAKYQVDATTDLENWSEVAASVTGAAGSETSWTETGIPAANGRRFYRVRKASN